MGWGYRARPGFQLHRAPQVHAPSRSGPQAGEGVPVFWGAGTGTPKHHCPPAHAIAGLHHDRPVTSRCGLAGVPRVQVPAPSGGQQEVAELHVSIRGDALHFSERKKVLLQTLGPGTLVQTDKAVYKPGQTGERAGAAGGRVLGPQPLGTDSWALGSGWGPREGHGSLTSRPVCTRSQGARGPKPEACLGACMEPSGGLSPSLVMAQTRQGHRSAPPGSLRPRRAGPWSLAEGSVGKLALHCPGCAHSAGSQRPSVPGRPAGTFPSWEFTQTNQAGADPTSASAPFQ